MSYLQKQFSFIWNHRIEIRMSILICIYSHLTFIVLIFGTFFGRLDDCLKQNTKKCLTTRVVQKIAPNTQEPQPTWLGTRHLTSSAVAVDQFNVKLCWLRCGEIRCNDSVLQPWSGLSLMSLSSLWLIHNLCALRYQVMYPRYHCDTC